MNRVPFSTTSLKEKLLFAKAIRAKLSEALETQALKLDGNEVTFLISLLEACIDFEGFKDLHD